MTVLPRALAWQRTDSTGGEFAGFDDRRGFRARGVAFATRPTIYSCRYELITDDAWATTRFEVTAEGEGWLRTLRMERATGRWRVTTGEQGNLEKAHFPGIEDPHRLADAVDVDLYNSPLTNTLPIRRLGLIGQPAGTQRTLTAAWVLLPSLAVMPYEQTYTVLGEGRINYASKGFTADIEIDGNGYVVSYPGLARQ
jgi:hypothetical protein